MNLKKLIDNAWDNRSLLKDRTTINSIETVIIHLTKEKSELQKKLITIG